MRREEVPQDENPFYEGHRRACYAVARDGRYVVEPSSGWSVERIATAQAMSDLDTQLEQTRRAVLAGRLSPLAYHMESRQMVPKLLGQTVGIGAWRVRRHLRPEVFARLRPALLRRYADALGVRALDELLERGVPVGLQANMFWLEYFPREFRSQFNGHNLVALRRDGDEYELSDPMLEAPVRCSVDALTRARFAKGPLAPRGALFYTTDADPPADLSGAILGAVRDTARRMLAPLPLLGVRGIRALGRHVRRWPAKHADSRRPLQLLGHVVRMQEEVGSGGAGFRYMYAAFLQQAGERIDHAPLREASERMTRAGDLWHEFAVTCGRLIKDRVRAGESFAMAALQLDACAAAEEDVYRFLIANTRSRRARARATAATK